MVNSAILVVDVQKEYGDYFSLNYLKKLNTALKKFKFDVFTLYEPRKIKGTEENRVGIPEFLKDISKYTAFKRYSDFDLFKDNHILTDLYIKNNISLDKDLYPFGFTPTYLRVQKGVSPLYMYKQKGRVINSYSEVTNQRKSYEQDPDYYVITTSFYRLLENLRGYDVVYIVGGGLSKCVKITNRILKAFDINSEVIEDLCYDISIINSNRRRQNCFDLSYTYVPRALSGGGKSLNGIGYDNIKINDIELYTRY